MSSKRQSVICAKGLALVLSVSGCGLSEEEVEQVENISAGVAKDEIGESDRIDEIDARLKALEEMKSPS